MLTPLARRRPGKVAREVASLDHLSGGRVTLGVGLGEYAAFGEDPDPRVRAGQLDEALGIIDTLWKGEPSTHHGDHFRVEGITFLPRPVQNPRPPVWVGGFWPNKAPMKRAAQWDGAFPLRRSEFAEDFGWSDLWLSPDELAEAGRFVDAQRAGRDGGFDLIATGATSATDTIQAADRTASYEAVGAHLVAGVARRRASVLRRDAGPGEVRTAEEVTMVTLTTQSGKRTPMDDAVARLGRSLQGELVTAVDLGLRRHVLSGTA